MTTCDLAQVAEPARSAATRLRDGLLRIFDHDFTALWLYGGQLEPGGSPGDVDLHSILRRDPSPDELTHVRALHTAIERDLGIRELDAWHVLLNEVTSGIRPRDVNWPVQYRDENWAIKRAHWLAGAYVLVHGDPPERIVARPAWQEVEQELLAQVDAASSDEAREGDVAGLTLRLCRVLRTLVSRDVVHFKVGSGRWALSRLSHESGLHVEAAIRSYVREPLPQDPTTLRYGMPRFREDLSQLVDDVRTI